MNNNTNNNKNINDASEYIHKLYDKLTYFDMYGSSVIIFLIITMIVFFVHTYCQVMQVRKEVADDWNNQRCNPKYMPFAGYITRPEGTSAFDYTNENFQYCVQNILTNVTGYALQPFKYMINSLQKIFEMIGNSIQKIRDFTNIFRQNIKVFAEDVLHRILNVMVPLQNVFIALSDSFQKIQGVMTAGLYTMLGTYYTLQSLMGAMLEMMIKMLIVLVVIVVGLWVMPFTWPAAAATSAVFLSISIPLSIIVLFMSEVLHIKTSAIPKLRCFDKNTLLTMNDGTFKKIQDVEVGDILENKVMVTAKMKVDASDLRMFSINNILVSESHIIKCEDNWIAIRDHPLAIELPADSYTEPYLYCLNTSSKEIIINDLIFTDWDEIYGGTLDKVIFAIPQNIFVKDHLNQKENIHKYLDVGFDSDMNIYLANNTKKQIKDISIGDILSTKGIVYGIVEIDNFYNKSLVDKSLVDKTLVDSILGNNINKSPNKLYHLLVSNKCFETDGKIIMDYNDKIDFICSKKII
jgi:hypothetical protein